MFFERTSVGLDVHARSTTAWALDSTTGEIYSDRLVVAAADIVDWVRRLPQPAPAGPKAPLDRKGPTPMLLDKNPLHIRNR